MDSIDGDLRSGLDHRPQVHRPFDRSMALIYMATIPGHPGTHVHMLFNSSPKMEGFSFQDQILEDVTCCCWPNRSSLTSFATEKHRCGVRVRRRSNRFSTGCPLRLLPSQYPIAGAFASCAGREVVGQSRKRQWLACGMSLLTMFESR